MTLRRTLFVLALLAPGTAFVAKKLFAYDMTTSRRFTGVYLAPAGTTQWGPNQAKNDNNGTLDPSERLLLTGIGPGRYDVKLVDQNGRVCVKHGANLATDTSFVIRDGDLERCE